MTRDLAPTAITGRRVFAGTRDNRIEYEAYGHSPLLGKRMSFECAKGEASPPPIGTRTYCMLARTLRKRRARSATSGVRAL